MNNKLLIQILFFLGKISERRTRFYKVRQSTKGSFKSKNIKKINETVMLKNIDRKVKLVQQLCPDFQFVCFPASFANDIRKRSIKLVKKVM